MTPPRLASWLLRRLLPRGNEGDTIHGDLLEEFHARAEDSPARAAWWYRRAVLSMLLRYRRQRGRARPPRQRWHEALAQDVRYAGRTLARTPAFSVLVIVTLALAIGANTAVFSALNAVLLRPLPYPAPDRLVRLVAFNPPQGIRSSNVSAADFTDWQRDAHTFEALAAYATFSTSVTGATADAPAERVAGARVYNLFAVLGIPPAIGRDFRSEEARPTPPSAAVVSFGFWQRRFGGDRARVGKPLRPGAPTTLVGVMPRGFAYPERVDLWVPATLSPEADSRDNRQYEAIGRLAPGVSVERAQAELDAISLRLDAAYPASNRGWRVRAVPLNDYIVGDARGTLLLLLAAAGLVLLVGCANVANLFLAHAAGRAREIAVRSAIGAGRARIVGQVLTEAVMLSLAGGAAGLLLGRWGLDLLIAIGASGVPRLEEASLDRTVLLFSIAVSIGTGLLFGLAPALQLSRASLVAALREGTRGSGSRSRTRQALVVSEIAIALVLLAAAGLLARSIQGLQRVDPGFDPHQLLTARVTLGGPKYRQPAAAVGYFDAAVARIGAQPDVRSAAAVLSLPVDGGGFYLGRGFIRPGRSHPLEGYNSGFQIVTPGYFGTLGTPLAQGRDFDEHDTAASAAVGIVNRTFAQRFFPGENPIGQKVLVWKDESTPREIIGLVGDLKGGDLTAPPGAELFVPLAQSPVNDLTFVVRTEGRPDAAISEVRRALQAVDPTQAAYDVRTFDQILRVALARQRFGAVLFSAFAGLGLALAAVGLYGVMTRLVAGRAHELSVRMALGARPSAVRGLVVRQALVLLALGLAIGIPGAIAAGRALGRLLYGVGPADPLTLGAVVALMVSVTCAAAGIPARRATRMDPASALRGD